MTEPDIHSRLAVIEAIGLRTEAKLDQHITGMERRVSRLEWLGGVITGIFTAASLYIKTLVH